MQHTQLYSVSPNPNTKPKLVWPTDHYLQTFFKSFAALQPVYREQREERRPGHPTADPPDPDHGYRLFQRGQGSVWSTQASLFLHAVCGHHEAGEQDLKWRVEFLPTWVCWSWGGKWDIRSLYGWKYTALWVVEKTVYFVNIRRTLCIWLLRGKDIT